jgi:hypothetical protein
MKHLLPIILALATTSAMAQAPDWTKAGHHLDRAGADKQAAIISAIVGSAWTGFAIHQENKQGRTTFVPAAFALMTVGVSVGFNLSSAGHLRKAGKVLGRN